VSAREGSQRVRGSIVSARRPTLASRAALATTAVAVVTVLIAGVVSVSLLQSAEQRDARDAFGQFTNNVAGAVDGLGGRGRVTEEALIRRLLRGTTVRYALVGPDGEIERGQPLARAALTADQAARVAAGGELSAVRDVSGGTVLVEARPTSRGGLILAQRQADARGDGGPIFRRTLVALLIGLGVAVVAGLILARLLARPLRRAASAAHALALGARDVRVPPQGPAEVAEVAESINTLAAALEHSEGRQREFLLSVSHELRTPLTAVTGFAESLADGVITGPDVRPVGATMLAESRRLERLVSDLLDLARLGAQDFRIDLQPVDLTALGASAADVWRARCEAVGVAFRAELPPHPVIAVTDATRVRQIVDGLAENALRVTPAGAPIVLAVRTEPPEHVAIEVRDGGPGLTPEDCAVAFDRSVLYERYRGVRRVGTGVGLALVHGLATRLGGSAEAGRAPEGGARFTVRMPLATMPPSARFDQRVGDTARE
jgi:two-component system, OmpR family, sensor kinase